jgi:hypothetical protein
MLAVMAVLRMFVTRYAAGSDLARFCVVAVPGVLWLRLTTSWLRRREMPPEDILMIGIGPLGRHTGIEIRSHGRPPSAYVGYLRFADEPVHVAASC